MRPDVQAPVPLLPSREVADLLRISHKPVREYIHQGHIRGIDNKSDGKHPTQAVSVQVLKGNRLTPTSYNSQVLQNRAVRFDLAFKAFFHLYISHQQHSNPAVRSRQYWANEVGQTQTLYAPVPKEKAEAKLGNHQVILRRGQVTGGGTNAAL